MLRKGKSIPLDYILPVRTLEEIKNRKKVKHGDLKKKERRTLLKNIIFNRIHEIRRQKRKPKLGDVLKLTKQPGWTKEKIVSKLKMLYSKKKVEKFEKDPKFDHLNSYLETIKKSFQHNLEAISEIDQKVVQL